MDSSNMNAMFGPFQEEYEEDEQQRKNKREYRYYRSLNYKMVQQCNIVLGQIKQVKEQNRVRNEQRAAKVLEIERLKETARVGRKTLHDLLVTVQNKAAKIYDGVEKQGRKATPFEVYQMKKLNDIMEQQAKNLKIYTTFDKIVTEKAEKGTHLVRLAEKEKEMLADEALIKVKMAELEELKKERDRIKNLKEARRAELLKEIAYYDEIIKERQEQHALKAKYLKEIEEAKAMIDIEKEKALQAEGNSLTRTASTESVDLDEGLPPPIVFKDPNDFPILCELIRSPSIVKSMDVAQKAKVEKILKKMPPKAILNQKKNKNPARLTRKLTRSNSFRFESPQVSAAQTQRQEKVVEERKLAPKVDDTPKINSQNEATSSIETEVTVPSKELAKQHKTPLTKQTPTESQTSTIPAKKVAFSETLDIQNEIIISPQVETVLAKPNATEETPKTPPYKIVPKSIMTAPETSSKAQVKKVNPKLNFTAQNSASNAKPKKNKQKSVDSELKNVFSDMEVDQQASDEENQSLLQSAGSDKNLMDHEVIDKNDDFFFGSSFSTGTGDDLGEEIDDIFPDDNGNNGSFNYQNNSANNFNFSGDNNEPTASGSGFFG